jgi:hypothetical protein
VVGGRVVVDVGGAVTGVPPPAPDAGTVVAGAVGTVVDGTGTLVEGAGAAVVVVLPADPAGAAGAAEEPGCSRATTIPITAVNPPVTSTVNRVSRRMRASARVRVRGEDIRGVRVMGCGAVRPWRGVASGSDT